MISNLFNIFYFIVDEPDPLIFQPTSETVELKKGNQFSVIYRVPSIGALGNPKGTLMWFLGNNDTANVIITPDDLFTTLTIKNVRKENNGTYTCRVENPVGSRNKILQLVVLGEAF